MLGVVIGGSGSGKSEFAESLIINENKGNNLFYLATMQPFDEEAFKKIERHRKMRAKKNFDTIECQTHLEKVNMPKASSALLECMSNLVANEMFSPEGAGKDCVDAIKEGLKHLLSQTENLVVVTNNVFEDGIAYEKESVKYIKNIGLINQWLCQRADRVVEVVFGIPIDIK
ncbi:adenosylcobinamide kinase /adenosylcobinamide-phosphate guanylyltransferase [Acetitomaculum ruminis DSM 5522]|uniref:Adenosylcobinamide kinase n=1 Tax=Acetitomaculum ruminis DSM 5522 TaxID=1120918 RepID=A0A1I0WXB2_9FIRM|nr:bifunctional adenosylcobinamide kinase/adenosylcobinamide-phosphate guanylyltransferase [Acetitomaculum ruminis]SFA92686.1 adenosylcobinamide kinase /adenosylcobinamide-phosphate guanylyltransferase [Acetitomaculum ruminis DSM 5522]